ncbi:hypothetical protein QWA68_016846 [Fusarium oxysporum]|nr:hypothetical protein QWA68_016846 [Fusarium oxysporum]
MSILSISLQIAFFALSIMALSPRDAIHADDIERYDEFMNGLSESQFLDMHLENQVVKIDVYTHPSNDHVNTTEFKPSANANRYFEQENDRAVEVLGEAHSEKLEGRACKRDKNVDVRSVFEKRVSRCYQFCGSIANCRGNNGCLHCYAVRQGCLWQKWCR